MTYFPRSCPRNLLKSCSLLITAVTTSASTTPLVPGVHAFGYAMTGKLPPGEIARAENFSLDHPRPNGPHVSRFTLTSSHSLSFFLVQSAAALICGEPVKRAPYTSVR